MTYPPAATRLVGLAAAALLAGCGVGQQTQTYQSKAAADSTNVSVGAIAVRNLAVAGPRVGTVLSQGTDAPVNITLVNQGGDDDVLTQVTSPAAASVVIEGPDSQLPVPRLSSSGTAYSLLLRGLTGDLQTGTYIEMTLTFSRNGIKTVNVPVQTTSGGVPRPTGTYEVPETDSAGQPLQHGSPEATKNGSSPKGAS